jgi:hypothetical protein
LIDRLRQEPDPLRQVRIGFRHPHSYRGYYMDLAFERAENVTVGEMLAAAESALDATFQGWKGGDYTMSGYTDTWLVEREGCVGETIGAILLDFLLQDPEAAYRAGREDAVPEIQKLRADVAELNTELSVAERDHCGCLGTTLCAYREEDQPAGPGVQPIEEQRTRQEDQERDEEQEHG